MSNRLIDWNVETKQGNPTKSIAINNLIKKVEELYVQKLGVSSQARMQFEIEGLGPIINIFQKDPDLKKIILWHL